MAETSANLDAEDRYSSPVWLRARSGKISSAGTAVLILDGTWIAEVAVQIGKTANAALAPADDDWAYADSSEKNGAWIVEIGADGWYRFGVEPGKFGSGIVEGVLRQNDDF